jgi:hypothetical protein
MERFTKLYKDLIEVNLDTNEHVYEDNYYIGTYDPTDPFFEWGASQRQKLAWNAFGKLEDGLELAVKNAKIFINDIQDEHDYDFACGIVSALQFIIDGETHTELNELLEKQNKWEQTRNDKKSK